MKLMWITFAPIGQASVLFYNRPTQSGGWVDASLKGLLPHIQAGQLQLDIVSLGEKEATAVDAQTTVTYHMLPLPRLRGQRNAAQAVPVWKAFIEKQKPDLIQIWGTEFTFGLDVMDAAGQIPVCVFIQGVMSSLVAHPLGDVPEKSLMRALGITVWFKFRSLRKWRKIDAAQLPFEAELVRRAAGVLVDSEWTRAQYGLYTDRFYNVPLPTKACFREASWSINTCQRHTLFTVAGGNDPQKGVHNAVLAVAQLKDRYPDIRLYIPGNITSRQPHFLYDSIYIRHMRKLIGEYGLQENVVFTGSLAPEQMAQHMADAHVFVMPSCVENHSSTLREAMMVGTPAISASVGCVVDLIEHEKNGFMYRYNEYQTLAHYIHRLFSDDALAQRIGQTGKLAVTDKYPQDKVGEALMAAYQKMKQELAE